MAELKHTFTSGRMNKDFDERLLPNGEYRDALNVHVSSSEGNDVGAIENTLGNIQLSSLKLSNPKTIGSLAYPLKDKIYWLVSSDFVDGIYEYSQDQDTIVPILIDSKNSFSKTLVSVTVESNYENEFVLSDIIESSLKDIIGVDIPKLNEDEVLIKNNLDLSCEDPNIKISIPYNTILRKENDKLVFKNISYDGKRFGKIDLKFDYTEKSILNFSKQNLVTGINIIDGMLFWTDNLNQPRKINISRFKKFTNTLLDGVNDPFSQETRIYYETKDENGTISEAFRTLKEEDITVAKKAPKIAPKLSLFESLVDNTVINRTINFYKASSKAFQQELGYTLEEYIANQNLYSNVTSFGFGEMSVPNIELAIQNAGTEGASLKGAGDIIVIAGISTLPNWEKDDIIEIIDTNTFETLYTASVKTIGVNEISLLIITRESDDIDNINYNVEFSKAFDKKPIYELNFVRFAYRWKYFDGEYSTLSPFSEAAFIPNNFVYDGKEGFNKGMENQVRKVVLSEFDTGSDEVSEIEILFKESGNQNIYALEGQKRLGFKNSFTITRKQIHSVLPNDQLLRAWDNVPKKAKAQEVTANRIVYGNYTQNYNIYNDVDISVSLSKRNDGYKRTVKSNRNYQVGIVYMDEFNRHSPVLSNSTGALFIDKKEAIAENAFSIKLNNKPPSWATHFKHYIKEPSSEYYNIGADRFYTDEENGFTYISFPSSERNKVTEGSYLLLKKKHGENTAVLENNNRYKIINISNEAPDFVAGKMKVAAVYDHVNFATGFGSGQIQQSKRATLTPVADSVKVQIESIGGSGGVGEEVSDEQLGYIKTGNYIKFKSSKGETKKYEIEAVKSHRDGETEIEIVFKKPFGKDVDVLYFNPNPDSNLLSNISIEILEKNAEKGAKEFDGRFFIKLSTSGALKYLDKKLDDREYVKTDSFQLKGKQAIEEIKGTGFADRNVRKGSSVTSNPPNPLFIPSESTFSGRGFRVEETTVNVPKDHLQKFVTGSIVSFSNDEEVLYKIINTRNGKNDLRGFPTGISEKNGIVEYKDIEVCKLSDPDEKQVDISSFFPTNDKGRITINFLKEIADGEVPYVKDPAIFETEPIENPTELNIYYETEKAFPISQHGINHTLNWYNAICFGNGVESNRIRDDFNAIYISNGVKASSTVSEQIREEHKFNGVIYSGIINSRSSVNRSNEFNMANSITKDFLPSYGSIQKLHAWDDSMVILCEDKALRVYANKSALYNADGSTNLISDKRVLGDPVEYAGDFGISKNPESFASYGFRCYFTDQSRGVVLRLSKDGLTPISSNLMGDFFKDRFFSEGCYSSSINNDFFIGSYDQYNNLYNLSFTGRDTVCFNENVNGWVARKSFIPQFALSLNNRYYSYDLAELYQHDSTDVPYNNFYGTQYNSFVELEINDDASVIKKYKTLGYEGTAGWSANIITDQEKSSEFFFKNKENKYFSNIPGETKSDSNIDAKKFNFQGVGKAKTVSSVSAPSNTSITFRLSPNVTNSYTSDDKVFSQAPGTILPAYAEIRITPKNKYELDASRFNNKNAIVTKDGNDLILKYAHGFVNQPTNDKIISIELCRINFARRKNYSVSGSYSVLGDNFTASKTTGTYSKTGKPNEIKKIVERIITAKPGYGINEDSIKIDNGNIKLTKKVNASGSITLIEEIIVNDISESNIDYNVAVTPFEKEIIRKKISNYVIDKSNINNNTEESRTLKVYGEEGATFSIVFKNTTTDIENTQEITIPSTGIYEQSFQFEASNTAETFTIDFRVDNDTEFEEGTPSSIVIERPAKEIKSFSLFSQFGSTPSERLAIEGYIGENISKEFTQVYTLPTGTYTLNRQLTVDDIKLDELNSNLIIENLSVVFNQQHYTVTIKGLATINSISENVTGVIRLEDIINLEVDLTVAFSKTIAGGAATSNYNFTPSNYTITGAAGLTHSEPVGSNAKSIFTLTPTNSHSFIRTITNDDFGVYDSNNNDVTSTYALSDRMNIIFQDGNMIVSFNLDEFNLPLTDQTITVRPKKEISESTPVVTDYKVVFNAADAKDVYNVKSITVGSLDSAANSNFLFQAEFEIDRTSNIGDRFKSYFKDSGHTVTPVDSELTAATAGTYTDINGNSVTVAGGVEINNNKTKATINILANVSAVPSKLLGSVNISLGIEQYAGGDITLISGDCSVSDSSPARVAYIYNSSGGLYSFIGMGSALTEDFTGNNIFNNTGKTINTYKIKGVDELITTETKNGIERVIDIAKCSYDSDNDGIDDLIDTDDDNDGVLDVNDAFPLDPNKSGDNDGDGVDASVDIDDNNPAVSLTSDFIIALNLYGISGSYERSPNGELRVIGKAGGTARVNVELTKSVIGWSSDLEWRASLVDTGDGTNWANLNTLIGTPVLVDDDNNIISGTALNVILQETTADRNLQLNVDLYYKGTKIKSVSEIIYQNFLVETSNELTTPGNQTPDGTPLPSVLISSNIDQKNKECGRVYYPVTGSKTFPQVIEFQVGTETGPTDVYFNPLGDPDRMVVVFDNQIVLDTGYATWNSNGYKQRDLNIALYNHNLGGKNYPVRSITSITGTTTGPSGGNQSIRGTFYGYNFNKNSATEKVYVYIYAPLSDTRWELAMGCPNTTLTVNFAGAGGGG